MSKQQAINQFPAVIFSAGKKIKKMHLTDFYEPQKMLLFSLFFKSLLKNQHPRLSKCILVETDIHVWVDFAAHVVTSLCYSFC